MAKDTNCPNCGAPYDTEATRCPDCDTPYPKQTPKPRTDRAVKEKKGQPKDSLAMDAIAATDAGMTYGKWKAVHPNTKAENEAKLAIEKPKKTISVYEHVCRGCGITFLTTNQKRWYHDDACKYKKDQEKTNAKKREREKERKQHV